MVELSISLALFLIIALSCALEPGPNFIMLAKNSATRGRRAGFMTALGLHLGAYPAIAIAGLGLVALASTLPAALTVIKYAGAAYLVWLGIATIRSARTEDKPDSAGPATSPKRGPLASGFLLVVLNPRTYAFFTSLPVVFASVLTADLGLPLGAQVAVLAVATNLVFLAVDLVFVAVADNVSSRIRLGERARRTIGWLTGGALAAFGIRLAMRQD
ncbi:LysE family translocator [Oricola sp.]|uniref:LysE family translocator n=1 Tax=Oricola sp. TaxID=1979950 RepID=UPI003BAA33D4